MVAPAGVAPAAISPNHSPRFRLDETGLLTGLRALLHVSARCLTQTEDVLVDTRGNIFVTDKNWGLWVLRYSGADQPAPTDR